MYDYVATHKRLIMIVLMVLIVPPFAFFGIDSYFRSGPGGGAVARVGDYAISSEEFSRALREQQDQLRRSVVDGRIDPAMLDNPELRSGTLETLVQRRLLLESAVRAGIVVSDQQLDQFIAQLPEFQDASGKFSPSRAEEVLNAQGMRAQEFRVRLRQDLLLQQAASGLTGGGFVPRTVSERLARLTEQRREIAYVAISPEKFTGQVKLDAAAARQYYDANPGEFRVPAQARVEYVALSVPALMREVQVDPATVRQFYESNRQQFEVPESRQASHIFISIEGGEDVAKARARANEIYQEVRKKPGSFAELAKKYSQDPGSAVRAGDLGFIPRGSMKDVPQFEEALYKLKPGEISPPVESKLGLHIIRLTKVQPAQGKGFEALRSQIEADLKKQVATRRFAEMAEAFGNAAYEQSESLKPAAEVAKTPVQTSGWLTRARATEAALNNPRLLAAIFSDESLKGKRNTEAIEVAPGVLVAARVIEHKPEGMQSFDAMRAEIEKRLITREAGRIAAEEGRRLLAQLQQGKPAPVAWSAPQTASIMQTQGMPEAVLRQAFRADVSSLPAYAGVENLLGGYTLVRVSRVQDPTSLPPERVNAVAASLRQVIGQETITAYMGALRQKIGVSINKEQIEKKADRP